MTFYDEGYRFVPWRQVPKREWDEEDEEQSVEADLPEHIYSELLADMGEGPFSDLPYLALRLMRWPKNEAEPSGLKPVPEELVRLLKAGMIYPPAIAIARDSVGWLNGTEDASEADAIERFTNALRDELDAQRNRPFFLAKSLAWHYIAYVKPGDYCWILRYDPTQEEPLWYMSRDYEVYTCPITDFDVDIAGLCERFGVNMEANKGESADM